MSTAVRHLPAREKMNRIYRFQRFIYNPTRRYYLLGRIPMVEGLDVPDGGRALEIGAGTGWNLCRAARRYPNAEFHGLEVSTEMLATARGAVAAAGLAGRVRLAQANATTAGPAVLFGVDGFDRIFISYTLSMITPGWETALGRAADALAPGGSIHICEFGPCTRLPRLFRRGLYAWLHRFHVTPIDGLEQRLSDFAAKRRFDLDYREVNGAYTVLAVLRAPGGGG
jgi:S-adenosylmethionine-diacylgycerolhomoserine-N-methlytransferase